MIKKEKKKTKPEIVLEFLNQNKKWVKATKIMRETDLEMKSVMYAISVLRRKKDRKIGYTKTYQGYGTSGRRMYNVYYGVLE